MCVCACVFVCVCVCACVSEHVHSCAGRIHASMCLSCVDGGTSDLCELVKLVVVMVVLDEVVGRHWRGREEEGEGVTHRSSGQLFGCCNLCPEVR